MELTVKLLVFFIAVMITVPSVFTHSVDASAVPDWIKNTAKWYGDGDISEDDFLNAIKYLIQQKIIIISDDGTSTRPNIVIPNGNSEKGSHGFYEPMHLDITKETVVIWENQDDYGHTVQSQDDTGNVIPIFNSDILLTGQTFEHKFTENGDYQYFCTLHPWRVGTISVI
ncbi:MAG: hypothetical protein HOE01_01505 [Thaumarchaeota archaeon]|jgi:plastocyanin|nr:hypothetical protein [Nitrososphaerota archaeon]MBT4175508.1 hypothetical protein [Nitrososphaerota archaeon]MBT4509807.1 hypothetical protein [Nitrososphaerota archaeon]MBT5237703.1 hypothetical protein [Nitrososphaerota archaeon]MBT5993862.1 hypothetical protein [Nitrososphaerota archaeon]